MGVKNTLNDLNNILFEQLERLMDEDCDLDQEIKRAKAVSNVAKNIIDNANVALEGAKYVDECNGAQAFGGKKRSVPIMLESKDK